MARVRMLHPDLAKDERLAACEPLARLLYLHLHGIANKRGLLEDRPKRIAVETLPYDRVDVDALLQQLHAAGFIVRYTNTAGDFIQIPDFLKYQRPHKNEIDSNIEGPSILGSAPSDLGRTEHRPRSPVSITETVSIAGSVPVPVPVSDPDPKTGAVSESASPKSGHERAEELGVIAQQAINNSRPNDSQEELCLKFRDIEKSRGTKTQFSKAEIEREIRSRRSGLRSVSA